jgi:hypothetical protein
MQFWVNEPKYGPEYFALQRECQVIAHLQMMQAAVDRANQEGGSNPVLVLPNPKSRKDAKFNVCRFIDEKRLIQPSPEVRKRLGLVEITAVPPIRKCYGWLNFNTDELLPSIPQRLRPRVIQIEKTRRYIEPGKGEHTAIVYEYIEEGPNDPDKISDFINFMHLAGFSASSSYCRNWKSSMLVDFSDFSGILSPEWELNCYYKYSPDFFLRP